MTKLVFHSNAPWAPTGYGQQTALFAPSIAQHYDMALSSFYGLEGSPITWEGIPVYPGIAGTYGDEPLLQHATRFFGGDPRGGMVMTLMDVWVLNPQIMGQMNCACWCPVDHEPAPPNVTTFLMQSGCIPIAMSKFGAQMLGRLDPLYVPHGVDTKVYTPRDRDDARERAGVPKDAFLVGMVAANKGRPSRKSFVQAFQAFSRFAEEHENAYLYLHTMVNPQLAQGEDIPAILESLNVPQDRVMIADQYRIVFDPYSHNSMATIYSTLDVLLNPAMGEGFGVTVLEAQACGVPAIVTDFSAMREVCGAGWHVEYKPYWTGANSWMATPDVDDIVSALEECYSLSPTDRARMSQGARQHALQYDVHRVLQEHMLPALKVAEQRFEGQKPVRIAPRLKAAA